MQKENEYTSNLKPRLLLVSLVSLAIFFGITCTDNDKTEETQNEGTKALASPQKLPVFKLDGPNILNCEDLLLKANKLVVLKHQLSGIESDGQVELNLMGYSSDVHANHGKNKNPCFNVTPDNYIKVAGQVILGNNYINWESIAAKIFKPVAEGETKYTELVDDFGYIEFTPTNRQKTGCPKCTGHLFYKIKIYDVNKRPIKWNKDSDEGDTNPSPPADPVL